MEIGNIESLHVSTRYRACRTLERDLGSLLLSDLAREARPEDSTHRTSAERSG